MMTILKQVRSMFPLRRGLGLSAVAAATALLGGQSMAQAHHHDHRDRIAAFVPAVPGIVVHEAPAYEPAEVRVWVPPVYQTVVERVWQPEITELRRVRYSEGRHARFVRERVVVVPGHFEDVTRQELVTPGHYEIRSAPVVVGDALVPTPPGAVEIVPQVVR